MATDEDWKAFEAMKAIVEERDRKEGKSLVKNDVEAEVQFWRESSFIQYLQENGFQFNVNAMRVDRFQYWDRLAASHACSGSCAFRNLQEGFRFRMPNGQIYQATGIVYVCQRTLKPHLCGADHCTHQTLPMDADCTVCSLTGRVITENRHMSLARSREDPDVRVAGEFTYQRYFQSGNETDTLNSREHESTLSLVRMYTKDKKDAAYCMDLLQKGATHEQVVKLAKCRTRWRATANSVYDEQVMTSHYVDYQKQVIKDAHRSFLEQADKYVKRCAEDKRPFDIMHLLFLFNQYEKPAYRGVYFVNDVDQIKRDLRERVVDIMLEVWEKLSRFEGVNRDNLSFHTCARGILVIMAGHSVDHANGLRIQLKVDRRTGEPSRITEYKGAQSVNLSQYEIREFYFIPRIEGLVLAPASIVNQEKSNRKKRQRTKSHSSSRLIVSSNTRNKKGNNSARRSTGSNRNEGRMPSVKNVHGIIAEIIDSAKTLQDIEQFCYE